jgi:hypothetical protein
MTMIAEPAPDTQEMVRLVLAVARLGEVDLRGWWRSHALDQVGGYVLSGLLKRSWRAAALELDVASAARFHDEALGRSSALHLFSDHLPFRRWATAWLAEQKTAAPDPLFEELQGWDEGAARACLTRWTAGVDVSGAEPLGSGLLLGTVTRSEVDDPAVLVALGRRLAAAYLDQDVNLRPPYLDLVA